MKKKRWCFGYKIFFNDGGTDYGNGFLFSESLNFPEDLAKAIIEKKQEKTGRSVKEVRIIQFWEDLVNRKKLLNLTGNG